MWVKRKTEKWPRDGCGVRCFVWNFNWNAAGKARGPFKSGMECIKTKRPRAHWLRSARDLTADFLPPPLFCCSRRRVSVSTPSPAVFQARAPGRPAPPPSQSPGCHTRTSARPPQRAWAPLGTPGLASPALARGPSGLLRARRWRTRRPRCRWARWSRAALSAWSTTVGAASSPSGSMVTR